MRMRQVTWPGGRGSSKTTYLESATQFAYSLYNFYGATTTIKGSLHGSTPIVKRFSVENFLSPEWPQNGGFSGITGYKC